MKASAWIWSALLLCAGRATAVDMAEAMAACPGAARFINAQIEQQRAATTQTPVQVSDSSRRQQLLALQDEDQLQYEQLAAGRADTKALGELQVRHLAYLRRELDGSQPMPTVAEVGRDGVAALWLLVQHADADPALQARALKQLEPHAKRGDLDASKYALLTDRVLLASGKPQKFGSQLRDLKTGAPLPLENADALQRERAALGLMALEDYRCISAQLYRNAP